jgi:hypothetical protein
VRRGGKRWEEVDIHVTSPRGPPMHESSKSLHCGLLGVFLGDLGSRAGHSTLGSLPSAPVGIVPSLELSCAAFQHASSHHRPCELLDDYQVDLGALAHDPRETCRKGPED